MTLQYKLNLIFFLYDEYNPYINYFISNYHINYLLKKALFFLNKNLIIKNYLNHLIIFFQLF